MIKMLSLLKNLVVLVIGLLLIGSPVWADKNRAQYVPDLVVTEPGAIFTDMRAWGTDNTAFLAAKTAIGTTPTTLVISEDVTISTTTFTGSNITLKFVNGANIIVSGGGKLTIYGPIDAGPYQIFDDTDGATLTGDPLVHANYVIFANNPYIDKFYPQWWGANSKDAPASGDTFDVNPTTYDTYAIQNAVYAAAANGGGTIFYTNGTYFTHDTIRANTNISGDYVNNITHCGDSYKTATISMISTADTPVIQFRGADFDNKAFYGEIHDITIQRAYGESASCFNDTIGNNSTCRNVVGIDVYCMDYLDVKNVMVNGLGPAYTNTSAGYYKGNHRGLAIGIRMNGNMYGTITNSHVLHNSDIGILILNGGTFMEENYVIENGLYCLEGGGSLTGYNCGDAYTNAVPDLCPVYLGGPDDTATSNILDFSKQEIVPGGIVSAYGASLYSCRNNEVFHNFIGFATLSGVDTSVTLSGGKIFENDIDSNLQSGVYIKQDSGNIIDGNFISNTGGYNGEARSGVICNAAAEGGSRSDLAKFHWLGNASCYGIFIANNNTGVTSNVRGIQIKNNFMYGFDMGRTDYSTNYTRAPRGIYLGDYVETVHITGNYFDLNYLFIDAANGAIGGLPSIVLQSNFFLGGSVGSIGISVNSHTALIDLANKFASNITYPIWGTPSATYSNIPWDDNYNTLTLSNVNASGTITGGADGIDTASGGSTIPLTTMITILRTNGDNDLDQATLGAGTTVGQIKMLSCGVKRGGSDTLKINATFRGGTALTFSPLSLNDGCMLVWDGSGWAIITNTNGTLS